MRVFVSWSGAVSRQVALALREWLPSVVQAVKPWMSKSDIYKGTRWEQEIASELEKSKFGIVCVTPTNLAAPWLLYEAGALSKQVTAARVAPYVFGMEPAAVSGPLAQWQGSRADKNDTHELVRSINASLGEDGILPPTLDKVFERAWPDLADTLSKVVIEPDQKVTETRKPEDMFAEILELVRNIERTVAGSATVRSGISDGQLRQMIATHYEAECGRLETLRDDAVNILNALVEAGAVTREALNEATQR